jgi:hypothetical protein
MVGEVDPRVKTSVYKERLSEWESEKSSEEIEKRYKEA